MEWAYKLSEPMHNSFTKPESHSLAEYTSFQSICLQLFLRWSLLVFENLNLVVF